MLSGGGVRGAYEAGVVAGLVDVLGRDANGAAPFGIFAGTSVGAINAAFLASCSDRGDLGAHELIRVWESLRIHEHLDVRPLGLFGQRRRLTPWRRRAPGPKDEHFGRSLINPRAIEKVVRNAIDWDRLHENVAAGRTRGVVVAALNIASGRTTMFAELAPGANFRPSRDPKRTGRVGPLSAEHVLASAALPLIFPSRRVGGAFYCDGGLRFNTPISPAIRMGATRLVVISAAFDDPNEDRADHTEEYPSVAFLLGKLLNALLLDPVTYDLQILERFNRLMSVLDEVLTPEEKIRVQSALVESRGAPYRTLDVLTFAPSQDIGHIASMHVRENLDSWRLGRLERWLVRSAAHARQRDESDLTSYLLFEGGFSAKLIALGRADAHARADDIRAFFASNE